MSIYRYYDLGKEPEADILPASLQSTLPDSKSLEGKRRERPPHLRPVGDLGVRPGFRAGARGGREMGRRSPQSASHRRRGNGCYLRLSSVSN